MNQPRRFSPLKRPPNKHLAVLLVTIIAAGLLTVWLMNSCWNKNCGPSLLGLGLPNRPFSLLLMGTDLPYSHVAPRTQRPDFKAFNGRSDTMMLVMIDPQTRTVRGINIPRDTAAHIPGYGTQKINAANAIGGPALAKATVAQMLGIPVDHYVVVNVQGLVDAVNQVGGVTLNVPKKMEYIDWTAKLKIDLEPGVHTLTGNQAMGFVRFRHDDLGDIGRIQRQQIFIHAMINKMLTPTTWVHIPQLVQIARRSILTDMSEPQLLQTFNLVRATPRKQIQLTMLPGSFGSNGSWIPDTRETERIVARVYGLASAPSRKEELTICLKDASSFPGLADRMASMLRRIGYSVVVARSDHSEAASAARTRIIAQRGNYDEAKMVLNDLGNRGEIVNASIGDIYSSITIEVADDLEPLMRQHIATEQTQYQ